MFKSLVWTMVKVAAKRGAAQAMANQIRDNAQVRENLRKLAELATQAAQQVQAMQDALKADAAKGGAK
ncbi:hypothetical protein [Nocardiopsis sp. CA-288880]|uniref:hypothetical protein n=1 Tax=Nocardiopsis sp. CA-288880 TaxID=3239995 RepID=UPI003D9592AA